MKETVPLKLEGGRESILLQLSQNLPASPVSGVFFEIVCSICFKMGNNGLRASHFDLRRERP